MSDFRSRIARKVGLDNTATGDQTAIDEWINEGYRDVVRRAKFNVTSASFSLTSGSADYAMSSVAVSAMAVIDLWLDAPSQTYPMERIPVEEMIRLRRVGGSPPARYYTMMGQNLLLLHPTPGTGETLRFYTVNRPPAVSLSSDSTSIIPVEWDKAIELYALWQASEYDQQESSKSGQMHYERYIQFVNEMRKATRWLGGKHLAPALVGRRNRPMRTSRSQDLSGDV